MVAESDCDGCGHGCMHKPALGWNERTKSKSINIFFSMPSNTCSAILERSIEFVLCIKCNYL